MTEFEIALSRLGGIRKAGKGYLATCPCHHDQHQSLSLTEGNDGKALLYCHAGCEYGDIIKALNLELIPKIGISDQSPQIVAIYDYTDMDGELLYQVVRYQPKNFKQRKPDAAGGWTWNIDGIQKTLYHLPEVIQAIRGNRRVFVVEGEKDADNLCRQGQTATTLSGGASTRWPPYLIPLFENANVCIIPDNDEPGIKYAHYVASILVGWCKSLKLVTVPIGQDVSDYLGVQSIDNLLNMVDNAGEYEPQGAVTRAEFESWKAVNLYLWQLLRRKKKRVSKYD